MYHLSLVFGGIDGNRSSSKEANDVDQQKGFIGKGGGHVWDGSKDRAEVFKDRALTQPGQEGTQVEDMEGCL